MFCCCCFCFHFIHLHLLHALLDKREAELARRLVHLSALFEHNATRSTVE